MTDPPARGKGETGDFDCLYRPETAAQHSFLEGANARRGGGGCGALRCMVLSGFDKAELFEARLVGRRKPARFAALNLLQQARDMARDLPVSVAVDIEDDRAVSKDAVR